MPVAIDGNIFNPVAPSIGRGGVCWRNDMYQIKGEVSVERGLGLPELTTAQRTAYTPPSQGYTVYDTDLDQPYYWNGSSWNPFNVCLLYTSDAADD